ncbi:hypothetical protein FOWG_16813 [Fusarium oxysporum f. sp. lycopersici MN25]|nr:hypothetical protein FOWG_16813 [Fusarium oxysporum f. sp. lycopersici MN25]
MDQFACIQHSFYTKPSRELLQSVAEVQDTTVKRTPIDTSKIQKFLDDAVELTEILQLEEYGIIVRKIRLDIRKVIEQLGRQEKKVQDWQEIKLLQVFFKQYTLDSEERMVRDRMVRDEGKGKMRECQKSAGLKVEKVLDEIRDTFETAMMWSPQLEDYVDKTPE